ncbi:hypothetical protein TUM4249_18540 [Shewanella sp. KT0246]|nr:hypothetical protein TUM4249_18540 [Shewanella sp. KT0246]
MLVTTAGKLKLNDKLNSNNKVNGIAIIEFGFAASLTRRKLLKPQIGKAITAAIKVTALFENNSAKINTKAKQLN